MAFTVETGALIPNANAYVSVADCDTYHSDRGNSEWTGDDAAKSAALIKATAYLDGKYRQRWKGWRVSLTQALEWPRYNVDIPGGGVAGFAGFSNWIPSDSIPQLLKDAVCEAALRALSGDIAPDLKRGGRVKRKKVGPVETEYESGAPGQTVYQIIDQLISRLVNSADAVRG